jgi:diacylglycerol kinase family enzyme
VDGGAGVSPGLDMTRVGVITNPGSERNKQGLGDLKRLLDAEPSVQHAILDDITDVAAILRDFARNNVGVVVVAGGDGTVQAVLTELYGQRPYAAMPLLAVVPRGMTNMIAADVGLKRRGLDSVSRLLRAAAEGRLEEACVTRRILKLENALDRAPQYGMFFGGAGIPRAIEVCLTKIHPYKFKADTAVAMTVAGLLGGWLFRRGGSGEEGSGIFYGDRITLQLDDGEAETRECLIVLATTLDRLILGSRPFWNDSGGPLRFTTIGFPPQRLLRYARRLLYGGKDRSLPETSYRSGTPARVALDMDCPFTLDGEMLKPTPGREVILTAADEARFVRL